MKLVADLHIHSHFSRATSKNLTFEHLARWAQLKGVHVVGTGDVAHPGWLQEMREKLEPVEEGLFRLKSDLSAAVQAQVPPACQAPVRFILGGEISNIYKKGDRTRKIHNVVFAPSFEVLERLQARLEKIGNIRSDGRPILGLDSRDLLEIILDTDPACYLLPAHIWTPWFSLLGSKSGFDSVEECYADLAPHIFALETGLSSDPPMNWRVSSLDRYTLVSNSDAHSPEKLAREATLFDCNLAYGALFDALMGHSRGEAFPEKPADTQSSSSDGIPSSMTRPDRNASPLLGTIEFFPEEGKYHFDGHRACNIVWDPATTLAHRGLCAVCGKEVTVGVMHRVEELADRPAGGHPARIHPFHSLVPLPEVLGEVYGVGDSSKQVQAEYAKLLGRLGPELAILRDVPLEEVAKAGGERLAEGIGRMRRGEVVAQPGYDGEYGVIRVFGGVPRVSETQMRLFGEEEARGQEAGIRSQEAEVGSQTAKIGEQATETATVAEAPAEYLPSILAGLNDQQRAAVLCTDRPLVIVAGPGTGKTRTITVRIAYLILEQRVAPETILAVTFTNKAAGEMRERLAGLLGDDIVGRVTIKTFHAFGALLLREHAGRLGLDPDFVILTEEDRGALLKGVCPELKQSEVEASLAQISEAKSRLLGSDDFSRPVGEQTTIVPSANVPPSHASIYRRYEAGLRAAGAADFDDLILLPIRLLEEHSDVLCMIQARYRWISVDEYQDVNPAQHRLLRLLTRPSTSSGCDTNLCVIGDPDQAIYGFRGADRRYFLSFEQDYPGAVTLSLHRNYRSSQRILDAAMQVIARNPDRHAIEILTDFVDDVKLDVYRAPTDKAEAEYVVHQIEQMVGGTSYFSLDSGRVDGETPAAARSFADFAVLYRLSAQSRLLAEAFDRSGIPYQTVGQTPLHALKVVREALAFLWLLLNPRSQIHLGRVLAVGQSAKLPYDSLRDALSAAATSGSFDAAQRRRLTSLATFWRELEGARDAAPVAQLIGQVSQFMAQERGKSWSDADAERIRQLALAAVPFGNRLADFLESIVLQSETDHYDPRADRVTLMSLHASKGLEFPVVFIVGCEEGLLPYRRQGEASDIEEERRLFYVGLTRARNKLVLSHARTRFLYGQQMRNPVSPFVNDIESALKEIQEMKYKRQEPKPESGQLSLF